ncbi:hypothetical protein AQUCO_01000717v1 [Aquilegia coerulea]|uniref:Uncharacterized protein n=1 Tax=Aquilegia coerulea TaxID=218851 RepID=A0A2G5EB94_AQUCA|nr:hypothetical protein AQUCO_01000717v1 [Aquilegia coerulea]
MRGGGVTWFKENLAGDGNNVTSCTKVLPDVRLRIQGNLQELVARRVVFGYRRRGRPRRRVEEVGRQVEEVGQQEQEVLRRSTQDPDYLEKRDLKMVIEASRREHISSSTKGASSSRAPDFTDYDSDLGF